MNLEHIVNNTRIVDDSQYTPNIRGRLIYSIDLCMHMNYEVDIMIMSAYDALMFLKPFDIQYHLTL